MPRTGTFTVSIDTELAWSKRGKGEGAVPGVDYHRIPSLVQDVLSIFERHGIHATWAVVGHLFLSDASAKAKYPPGTFSCAGSRECEDPDQRHLWYGHRMVRDILACPVKQELACHSFYHTDLPPSDAASDGYEDELKLCQTVALREFGVHLDSLVFPHNRVGRLPALQAAGFRFYRSHHDLAWYSGLPRRIRGIARNIDALLALPPMVTVPTEADGLMSTPGNVFLAINPRFGYSHRLRTKKILRGLERAARTGKHFHLWFHEFNLLEDRDGYLDVLERVGERYSRLKKEGVLESRSIRDIGDAR